MTTIRDFPSYQRMQDRRLALTAHKQSLVLDLTITDFYEVALMAKCLGRA